MAVEVALAQQPKHLHRHASPVIVLAMVLLAFSALALNTYSTSGPNSKTMLARSFVTQFMHVSPSPSGLAKITFGHSSTPVPITGLKLQTGLAQTGDSIQRSLNFQALPLN